MFRHSTESPVFHPALVPPSLHIHHSPIKSLIHLPTYSSPHPAIKLSSHVSALHFPLIYPIEVYLIYPPMPSSLSPSHHSPSSQEKTLVLLTSILQSLKELAHVNTNILFIYLLFPIHISIPLTFLATLSFKELIQRPIGF